jgi:hypothetical protein
MSRGETAPDTQRVRPVGEQFDEWEAAAERREIPRAVDVRQCLEQADHSDREDCRDREERDRPA